MIRIGNWKKRLGAFAAFNVILLVLAITAATAAQPGAEPPSESALRPGYWYAREVDHQLFNSLEISGIAYAGERQQFYALLFSEEQDLQLATFSPQFDLLSTRQLDGVRLYRPLPLYNPADGRLYLLESAGGCCRLYSLLPGAGAVRAEGRLSLSSQPAAAAFTEQGLLLVQSGGETTTSPTVTAYELTGTGDPVRAAVQPETEAVSVQLTGGDLHDASLVSVQNLQVQANGTSSSGNADVRQLARLLGQNRTGINAVTAPTLDSTDDEQALSLFIARPQSVIEIAYQEPTVLEPMVVVQATLISSTNTWQWAPPSPDPAGITYLPGSNRLLISDSEVNEEGWWQGANLFLTSPGGALLGTDSTDAFSREPTGISVNPNNGDIFISDDDQHQFYHLAGFPISSDPLHTVNTEPEGSDDPEGIAYDPQSGHVFVVDGRDSEVYRFTPEGAFIGQFDVGSMGVSDPEGIAYDTLSGNLVVLDSSDGQVVEVTTSGQLVRDIELPGAGLNKPAGLVYRPASAGATTQTLYVVDRQQDNSDDPDENDGLLFEFEVPVDDHEPTPTNTPTEAPPTNTPQPTNTATATNAPPPTETPTATAIAPTSTPTASATSTATVAPPTDTPQATGSPTATNTPAGPTATAPMPTATPTSTPRPTETATPEGTVQPTPTVSPGERYRSFTPVLSFESYNQFGEYNNLCSTAYPLLTNRTYQFLAEDRDDWYRFTTSQQADVTIRLTNFEPVLGQIAVYRGDTCGTSTFIANNGNNSEEKVLTLGQQPAGTFYLYVSNDGPLDSQTLYSLIVQTR